MTFIVGQTTPSSTNKEFQNTENQIQIIDIGGMIKGNSLILTSINESIFPDNYIENFGDVVFNPDNEINLYESHFINWLNNGCNNQFQVGYLIIEKNQLFEVGGFARALTFFSGINKIQTRDQYILVEFQQSEDIMTLYCNLYSKEITEQAVIFVDNYYFDKAQVLGSVKLGNFLWLPIDYEHEIYPGSNLVWDYENFYKNEVNQHFITHEEQLILVQKSLDINQNYFMEKIFMCMKEDYYLSQFNQMCY